ncbi:hypothetical protein BJY52DRAFT_1125934, partial [Lactarius psammicola]
QKCKGFEVLESLITDMVPEDPAKRLNMEEVVSRFSEINNKLSTWNLRFRIRRKHEIWLVPGPLSISTEQ